MLITDLDNQREKYDSEPLYILSGQTSYGESLWSLEAARHLGSSGAEMPVNFQSDTTIITSNLNLAASRLRG